MAKNIKLAALITNVIAIAVTCAILLGSTFAWFTDSVSSSGNKIESGALKIDLELLDRGGNWNSIKEDKNPIFDYENWEPGYTDIKILKVENEETLALKWIAKFVCSTPLSELADVIDVYVNPSSTELAYPTDRNLEGYEHVGTVSDFVNTIEETTYGSLDAGECAYLGIALKMSDLAGNEYQNMTLGAFDIKIVAIQESAESDALGSDYDADLLPTASYVSSAADLKSAMLVKDAYIKLNEDIIVDASTPLQYGSYMFLANGREITIDLNGHSMILDETASKKVLYMFTTANGGTLNIVGEGTISAQNKSSGICWAMNKNDQINIYGGTYMVNGENWGEAQSILYTTSGSIDVYGGKFYGTGHWISNVEDKQGSRICIVFHEGVLFESDDIQQGDSARIKLADGCTKVEVVIGDETWYMVSLID